MIKNMFKNKFKRFGGEYIPDIIEYIKDYLKNDPGSTITVGCDSIQKRRKTIYAMTIMMYNTDVRNGAHVVFYRESHDKVRDNQERLYKEAQYVYDIGMYLDKELSESFQRTDLNEYERKRYKFHLMKCKGEYANLEAHREDGVIKGITIGDSDRIDFRLVDLHVDFNPVEGNINERGVYKNKSYFAYKSYIPWLRGMGFRTWAKDQSHAASTAADLLLKD
jgi:predicted RNase H-related nuclease YkuK (DUF458 family)